MRENGIRARHTRRYKVTTDSKHGLPVALDRNFTPTAPNQVWTPDITYLWTDEGWLYLAIVLDLFNREVVGWSLKPRMTADIVTCLLYTSDAADERSSVDLGGRRIIKKQKQQTPRSCRLILTTKEQQHRRQMNEH